MTRIVFFGTPDQALPALDALTKAFDVALVVTQPDRPRGRSGRPMAPPVKAFALGRGLAVAQPSNSPEIAEAVTSVGPLDLGVVVAYGRILRPAVLETPRHGILNLHFSLLPRWRGAAPVARALMAGDEMTGVTVIRLDEGLDTGPVLTAQAVDVLPDENAGDLTSRLARIGAALLVSVIPEYLSGEVVPVVQVDEGVAHAAKIEPDDRRLGQDHDLAAFLGRVRGLAPVPGATLEIDGKVHKILEARPWGSAPPVGEWGEQEGLPVVGVGEEGVALVILQPPGRRPQTGEEWLRGRHRPGGRVQ